MRKYLFVIANFVTLIALFAMEIAPNKYLANAFVLIKTWSVLQMTIWLAMWMTFKSKLPSPSTVNWALEITTSSGKTTLLRRFGRNLIRSIPLVICTVALLFGQWVVMMTYMVFTAALYAMRPAAREYLKGMTIDTDKKTVTIDV